MPDRSTLAKLLALALVAAVLCNGAGTYLKRTGVIDHEAYRSYWAAHCASLAVAGRQPEWQCREFATPEAIRMRPPRHDVADTSFSYVYEAGPAGRALKLVKDLFWMALIAVAIWRLSADRIRRPALRESWPLVLFTGYCALAFLVSAAVNGPWLAVLGLRSFLFVAAALLCQWLGPHVALWARCVAALLVAQAALVPFEMVRGIHLFHEWEPLSLASRAVGTMVQPNSMGVFAVAAMAFYYCFAPSRRAMWPLAAVALLLVLASGSGTGLVCAVLALLALLLGRVDTRRAAIAGMVGLVLAGAAVAVLLPIVSGRFDVFDSVAVGRVSALRAALFDRPVAEVIFGSGLGVNTNLALTLGGSAGPPPTDSALIGLLIQIGLIGTALFYATLAWAALRDARARPFYGIVAVCTLTMNVNELFPVNVLLGIAWAHSLWRPRPIEQAGALHGR